MCVTDKVNGSTIFEVLEEDEEDSRRRTDRPDIASFDLEGTQSEKKKRLETSLLRAHMRSQSAGNNTVFAIISQSPPSSSKKSKESRKSSNPSNSSNAVKAAKKFLKRLYNSATMPVRGHTKSVDVSTSTTPLFGGVRHPILPISSERCTSCLKVCETGELAEDEGCFVDTDPSQRSSFTPSLEHELSPTTMRTASREDPAEDSLFAKSISSTESHKPSPNNFRSWNEVFDHLRREIATMREKDIEILAELQHVEHQLRSVTKQTRRSSYEVSIDRDKLRPGDHVESMPL
ncbi:hypothetical protein AB6A40_000012 [Gnathostoma spinigerum]|uniref:Uncharacterized protein n=1 Tax=Gnathostoma spinigerum TaxID=75299 RepID=A0ABD6E9C4_9BILA